MFQGSKFYRQGSHKNLNPNLCCQREMTCDSEICQTVTTHDLQLPVFSFKPGAFSLQPPGGINRNKYILYHCCSTSGLEWEINDSPITLLYGMDFVKGSRNFALTLEFIFFLFYLIVYETNLWVIGRYFDFISFYSFYLTGFFI